MSYCDQSLWHLSHTERKSYACALRYVPCRILVQKKKKKKNFSTAVLHKCRMRNYVSTSAENGPAMAGPAGPVPAPMLYPSHCCSETSDTAM